MMNNLEDICCLCLSASNVTLINLLKKNGNGLTSLEKISSSLSQLANVFNNNADYPFTVCDKCGETIETVYQFNKTCLHNIEIYLSYKRTVKCEADQEEYNLSFETSNNQFLEKNEKCFIKTETFADPLSIGDYTNNSNVFDDQQDFKDVTSLTDSSCQVKEKTKRKRKKLSNSKSKNLNKEDDNVLDSTELNIGEEPSHDELTEKQPLKFAEQQSNSKYVKPNKQNKHTVQEKNIDKKEFTCEVCGKSYTRKDTLKDHLLVHTGVRKHICNICGKLFKRSSNLNNHIRTHNVEKPYKCDLCDQSFRLKGYLKQHKSVHTGYKPHFCDQCDLRFRSTCQLIEHKRIHLGLKPFKCNFCEKSFAQRSTFVNHRRLHTGEQPYSCDICQETFAQRTSLNYHKLNHHKN